MRNAPQVTDKRLFYVNLVLFVAGILLLGFLPLPSFGMDARSERLILACETPADS